MKAIVSIIMGSTSDMPVMESAAKFFDEMEIPFEINGENIEDIWIPDWVKNIAYWWIQGGVSDKEFAEVINYLINQNIITTSIGASNEI